jgi:hypothetical protein
VVIDGHQELAIGSWVGNVCKGVAHSTCKHTGTQPSSKQFVR